jgi:hypothetical protein
VLVINTAVLTAERLARKPWPAARTDKQCPFLVTLLLSRAGCNAFPASRRSALSGTLATWVPGILCNPLAALKMRKNKRFSAARCTLDCLDAAVQHL